MKKFCSQQCSFWSKVSLGSPGECWPWRGLIDGGGYGIMTWGRGVRLRAHRVSYSLVNEIPDGLVVCHACDNPSCCNPSHLFCGTQGENVADMDKKNRRKNSPRVGSKHHNAKLSELDVKEIRRLHASGTERKSLIQYARKEFGLGAEALSSILYRKTWKAV